MKGIVLAGGTGTRLHPLTLVTNKHLLPVGKQPMILHPIKKLINAGIDDIMVITGTEHAGAVFQLLGSGSDYDAQFTFRVQDKSGGIAEALKLCEDWCNLEPCCVILGDNIFEDELLQYRKVFECDYKNKGAMILTKQVSHPERFGVVEIVEDVVVRITEKPENPNSNIVQTGVYFYDYHVFQIISKCKYSSRGELEITDVNNAYIEAGRMRYRELCGHWTDAGTFESYIKANKYDLRY